MSKEIVPEIKIREVICIQCGQYSFDKTKSKYCPAGPFSEEFYKDNCHKYELLAEAKEILFYRMRDRLKALITERGNLFRDYERTANIVELVDKLTKKIEEPDPCPWTT